MILKPQVDHPTVVACLRNLHRFTGFIFRFIEPKRVKHSVVCYYYYYFKFFGEKVSYSPGSFQHSMKLQMLELYMDITMFCFKTYWSSNPGLHAC